MDEQPRPQSRDDVPDIVPALVRPVAHLRSPMLEQHDPPPERPPELDPDRLSLLVPSAAALRRELALPVVAAAPVLLYIGWQAAMMVAFAAAVARLLDRRSTGLSFTFGDGFLPFRSQDGWPHGVQEDDDVRWNWTPGSSPAGVRAGHRAPS